MWDRITAARLSQDRRWGALAGMRNPDFLNAPLFKDFAKEFEARHRYVPDSVPSHGYDAMLVVLDAARRGEPSAEGVLRGLGDIKEFTGVNGTVKFTPDREITTDQSFWKIQKGAFTQYRLVPYDQVK